MTQVQAHNATHNERGYGYNPHAAKAERAAINAAEARIVELMSRAAEVKAAWNAAVAAHTVNGQVRASDLPKIERMAGVTRLEVAELKSRGAV